LSKVRLVAATLELLEAYQRDPGEFAELLGSPVPHGWPEFPEGIEFTIDKLRERPDQAAWWLHLFIDADDRLVGSGGFVGPPEDGVVELGYEIAPEFRRNGYATAAARAMVEKATATGSVHTVIAHTLADENPSTRVLRRVGFDFVGEVPDEEQGTVWRWELSVD
jgi:RimJ/RimL family protein N-acetyltransferase